MALTRPRAAQIYDIDYKQATRVVTVANITLSGGAPSLVDGVSLNANDRILVTGQSTASQNGIYYVTTLGTGSNGTWARSTDTNSTGELLSGTIVMVTQGLIYADTQWKLTTDDPITIGSSALTFVQNYSANSISAGTSNVSVLSNSSVTISSAGTANVAKFDSASVTFAANLLPTANVTYSLGTTSQRWKDIWLSNSTIYLGNVSLSADATQLTINGSNVVTASAGGVISTAGNITGNYILGNGSQLTGVTVSSISANSLTGTVLNSGVVTSSLTSVGTLSVLSVSGNITGGNISATNHTGTTVSVTGTVTAASTVGGVITGSSASVTGTVTGASLAGTITTASQTNITAVGTLSSLSVTGNIASGNISATNHTGTNVSVTGTVTAASTVGGVITGTSTSVSGAQTAASTVGGVITGSSLSASGGVTAASVSGGVITGTSASISGNVTGGNLVTTGTITTTGNIYTGNILTNGYYYANGVVFAGGGGGGTPGGANTQIQYNNNGAFGGSAGLTFNNTTNAVATTGTFSATGNITGGNLSTAGQVTSTIATGTAPFVVASTTKVTNLNVEQVDGYHADTANTVSTIAVRDAGSNITAANFNGVGVSVSGAVTGASLVGTITTASQTNITGVGNITTGIWSATAVGIAYGGTGKTTAPAAMAALMGYTSTATAAGTTTLTNTSSYYQQFTGTSTQTVVLPVTSTLQTGWTFHIVNNSTGNVAVQSSGLNAVITVLPGTTVMCTCIGTALTTAADWEFGYTDFGTATGTGAVVLGTSPSLTTPAIGAATGTSVSVTGAVTAASTVGGVITGSSASVTGAVTAASTVGGVITGTSVSTTGNISTAGTANISTGNISGRLITASQTNITAIGTLTSLSVTANVQAGNLRTAGLVSATGSITGGTLNASGNAAVAALLSITDTAPQGASKTINIASGTNGLAVVANINNGSYNSLQSTGDIALLATGNSIGNVGLSIIPWASATSGIKMSTVSNVTTITLAATTISVTGNIVNGQATGVGNIGASGATFNTIFAKATSAQYADLAEMYSADDQYQSGTVVEFGGLNEVTISTQSHSPAVAGIISTNPSYLMNSALDCEHAVEVALTGRVPCQVVGTIRKGDRLVASNLPGVATVLDMKYYEPGCIIGKALEDYDSIATGIIEVAVGRF